jgi:serine kinase of HPr protein (carbohydrate metabolism regulator)
MTTTVHATCVAIEGRAILIRGRSGSGKSDLALRLIDRGARLVSDDYTILAEADGRLRARPPEAIEGKLEVRGVGLVALPSVSDVPVCLIVDLDERPERLPEAAKGITLLGMIVPAVPLAALEPSAPLKLEQALLRFGLELP